MARSLSALPRDPLSVSVLPWSLSVLFADAAREACRQCPGGVLDKAGAATGEQEGEGREQGGGALSETYDVEDVSWSDPRVLLFADGPDPMDAAGGVQDGGAEERSGVGGDNSVWIATLDLGHVACPSLERCSLQFVSEVWGLGLRP
jgi:hypothetical protein